MQLRAVMPKRRSMPARPSVLAPLLNGLALPAGSRSAHWAIDFDGTFPVKPRRIKRLQKLGVIRLRCLPVLRCQVSERAAPRPTRRRYARGDVKLLDEWCRIGRHAKAQIAVRHHVAAASPGEADDRKSSAVRCSDRLEDVG